MSKVRFIKIVIVGDCKTGKTNFIKNWKNNTFQEIYLQTIMTQFEYKEININGNVYNIQLWDLSGKIGEKIIKIFAKDAFGCIVMSDATQKQSRER